MKTKTKWLIWLQFASLSLFLFSEVNARRPCGRGLLRDVKLPAHTKIASKQRRANHVTVECDEGYYFSKGEKTRDLSCRILKKISNIQIPRCKGCGEPPGIKNGTVNFPADSVGSVAVYSCDVGFTLKGSRKQRKCRSNLRWSGLQSRISCQNYSDRSSSPFKPFDARARIVGGNIADERNWPWVVSIRVKDKHICGGTLINHEFVLTAAHCFNVERTELHNVKVSLQNRNYNCLELHIHHDYTARNFKNDIALLKIPKLKHFIPNQQVIFLPRELNITKIIKDGNEMYVVGWGRTTPRKPYERSNESHISENLKQVKLPFKANKFCVDDVKNKTAKALKKDKNIWYFNSTTQFCAGDITGQKDACHGDSGGPAMVFHVHPVSGKRRWFLVGVISWGYGCAQKGEVGYYTKVSAYVDWIDKIAQIPSTNKDNALSLKSKEGLDLIFVLDTSGSMNKRKFNIAKEFMKKIIQKFGIDPRANGNGTHIACVSYGTHVQKEFTFNDTSVQTLEKALKRIEKIKNTRGGITATMFWLALDMVQQLILPFSQRPNSSKTLLFITDGSSYLGGSTIKAAEFLEHEGVEIYVIGIGKRVKYESLRIMTSKDENVFAINSLGVVNKAMKMIVKQHVKEVSGKRPCGRLLRNVKLPAHTKFVPRQSKANHATLTCDKGYFFSKRKTTKDLSCNKFKNMTTDQIPKCKGCGEPPGIKNGKVKFPADSVGSVAVYSCDVGFTLTGSRNKRKCTSILRWSGLESHISCQSNEKKRFPKFDARERVPLNLGLNLKHIGGLYLRYKGGLDLIFVVDTSSSIAEDNLKIALRFMKKMVEIFGIDPRANGDGTHIACVTYGTRAQIEFTFNEPPVQTKEKALKRIDNIIYIGGGTATRLALDMVRTAILPSAKRADSTKALFLVTDGESNVGGSPEKAARYLKEKEGVEIYVIGIGKRVKYKSLRELASNDNNVFSIRSYKQLNQVMKRIVTLPAKDYSECGASPFRPFDARARIVGGKIAEGRNDWPWAVRVLVEGIPHCGGTLINQEFVLTAAHCFEKNRTKAHHVQVLFQDKKRTVLASNELHIHQDFKMKDFRNDIALIKIPKLKRFTRNQQAICLPREVNTTKIIKHGNEMYAVGWGRTTPIKPYERSDVSDFSRDLKQVKLPFKANKFCKDNVKNKAAKALKKDKGIWYFNSTTQFCAGDITGQNDTCHGDSGGAGMVLNLHPVSGKWRWFQVGVISWGVGCAQKGEVVYYTKVSAYVDWIDKIIKS